MTVQVLIFGYAIASIAFIILVCLSIFVWDERITFDKGTKSVIIDKRRVADKKIKWKETKAIKFSDIAKVTIEQRSGDGWGYVTSLTTVGGISKTVLRPNSEKDAKDFAIRLCKITGANGYYIDDNKKSTPLIEAT